MKPLIQLASSDAMSRRALLRTLAGMTATGVVASMARPLAASSGLDAEHPTPREGITAEKVLPDEELPERAKAAYAAAREIPQVLDGLYCHCDCGERDKLRSLLSCFETRMPTGCGVCREEAVMALRLHREGRTLDEIRAAVDRRYGD
jgi:hypothetical protein